MSSERERPPRRRTEEPAGAEMRSYPVDEDALLAAMTDIPFYPPYLPDAMHMHNCMEIGLCLAGEGMLHLGREQTFAFSPGALVLVPQGVPHNQMHAGVPLTHWRYIALNEDKQTVYGTYFYHESETAGLGARIGERSFQELFNGRPLFAQPGSQTVDLAVVKSGAAQNELEVNGITGATLTSNGVNAMIKDGLGAYSSFIMGGASDDTAMACAPRRGHCGKGHCGQGQCPGKCGDQCQCGDGQCGQGNCAECPKQGTSACCQNNEVEQN